MNFWNETDPLKPRGVKDPDAVLDYPINFNGWLTDASAVYKLHTVTVTGGLVVDSTYEVSGIIVVILSGGTLGETASFTIRIETMDGRIDDRTFYLDIVQR